jgi:hypothetical protein
MNVFTINDHVKLPDNEYGIITDMVLNDDRSNKNPLEWFIYKVRILEPTIHKKHDILNFQYDQLQKYVKNLTKEELMTYDCLTVGKLKEFLYEHNFPTNAPVVIQRVEDRYYEQNNWKVYRKKGEWYYRAIKENEKIDDGTYLDKEEYPDLDPETLYRYTEDDLENSKEQYHPAWCCVYYKDDQDILFIDLHY